MPGSRLLVIDQLGYLPFGRDKANHLFSVVAERYQRGDMILTRNCPHPVGGHLYRRSAHASGHAGSAVLIERVLLDMRYFVLEGRYASAGLDLNQRVQLSMR